MNTGDLYKLFLEHPRISTDTRGDTFDSLFFCLKGENFDGNTFARTAVEKGAAFAIIDNPSFYIDQQTILVENTLTALQKLAIHHRRLLKTSVIGITGTNGKTTTKELIYTVLSQKYKVAGTKGNLNNHIGVPLTILTIRPDDDIAIIEMGASHVGEIEELCEIAKPNYGIITNIGKAHLEGFGNIEKITETKTALYRNIADSGGKIFINSNDPVLVSNAKSIECLSYGQDENNFCPGRLIGVNPNISLEWGPSYRNKLQTQLIGDYNLENILAAACTGMYFKIPEPEINEALTRYQPSNMRSQLRLTTNNKIILDAYNANPTSMAAAIENFCLIYDINKIAILGDMLELGLSEEAEHTAILKKLKDKAFDKVFLIGPVFSKINPYKEYHCFADSEKARDYFSNYPLKGATILLKGSRGIRLEKVLEVL